MKFYFLKSILRDMIFVIGVWFVIKFGIDVIVYIRKVIWDVL